MTPDFQEPRWSRRRWLTSAGLGLSSLLLPTVSQAALINGIDYLSLRTVAGKLGMKTEWQRRDQVLRLMSQWTTLDFTRHQRQIDLNDVKVHLGFPVALRRGMLHMGADDYAAHLTPILTPQTFSPVPKLYRIVLDPGHGGKDPGAQNRSVRINEKNTALDVAKRLHRILSASGYDVVLTRDNDRFIPLPERAAFANQRRADLFISLHFNAAGDRSVRGVETFVFTPLNQPSTGRARLHSSDRRTYAGNRADAWNALVGYYTQKAVVEKLSAKDRGLKRARFTVLRDLQMPGMLVEGGFLSNTTDARNIGSGGYRQRLAEAIAQGVTQYQRTLNRLRA